MGLVGFVGSPDSAAEIGELDHLKQLVPLGVEGAIVGSAIYRGTIDLAEAILEIGKQP